MRVNVLIEFEKTSNAATLCVKDAQDLQRQLVYITDRCHEIRYIEDEKGRCLWKREAPVTIH